jgi:integral membrane protein (TIGR01906 family)
VKTSASIARFVLIICLPLLFIAGGLVWGFNSSWLLEYGFNKYQVGDATGISAENLDRIATDWVRYINSADEYWNITLEQDGSSFELFTTEEQIHFRDVKQLIILDYRVLIVSGALILLSVLTILVANSETRKKRLASGFLWGSGLTILILICAGIAFAIDFDQLFLLLHHLIFTNPYWSAQGYMLLLFPGEFWFDAAMFCVAFMAALAVITGAVSLYYIKKVKTQTPGAPD